MAIEERTKFTNKISRDLDCGFNSQTCARSLPKAVDLINRWPFLDVQVPHT
jgi:hypothetical protein